MQTINLDTIEMLFPQPSVECENSLCGWSLLRHCDGYCAFCQKDLFITGRRKQKKAFNVAFYLIIRDFPKIV